MSTLIKNRKQINALALQGNGGSGMINYSTEEQIIGTWVDGRPLYQKTISLFGLSHGTYTLLNDVNFLVDVFGFILFHDDGIHRNINMIDDRYNIVYCDDNGNANIQLGSTDFTFPQDEKSYITLLYTKITDLEE